MLLQIPGQLLRDHAVRGASGLDVAELLLRLSLELRILDLDGNNGRQTLADIVAGQVRIAVLQNFVLSRILVEGLGQRVVEAHDVHAALGRVDVVHEAVFIDVVAVVVLHGHLNVHIVLRAFKIHDLRIRRRLVFVQIPDKLADAALVVKDLLALRMSLIAAHIAECDAQISGQKRRLAQSRAKRIVIVLQRLLEDLRIRLERDGSPGLAGRAGANPFHRLCDLAAGEFHLIDTAVLAHLHLQALRQGIDDRRADAVQAARHLVPAAAEFAAGVQNRENNLQGGLAHLVIDADRNAAAVIGDRDGVARIDRHLDMRTVAGERLIDRIVHDLIDQMVQSAG